MISPIPHITARAVIIKDNHILLAHDPRPQPHHYYELGTPFFYLPGGHINHRERAADAVIREIAEETGRSAQMIRFLGVMEHAWHFTGDEVCCHTHELNFIFETQFIDAIEPCATITAAEEHVAFKWVHLAQLVHTDLRPAPLLQLIPLWLGHNNHQAFQSFIT